MSQVSRRSFLLGGATAVVLAACGDDDTSDRSSGTTTTTAAGAGGLAVYRVFAPTQPAKVPLRLPIALADADGALRDEVPASITVRWGVDGSRQLSDAVEVPRHGEGIPRPYFPVVATFDREDTWRIDVDAAGERGSTTVKIVAPESVPAVPPVGERLIPLQTPTVRDGHGVDPVCTRKPACPFHDQTLEEAMASGKAVAFIISTPQFCQTAICGPVLDLLVERHEEFSDPVAFVHAEVYTDSSAKTSTEAVQAYGLTYEPALFLAAPDGTINARLDFTYDAVELDRELATLVQ